ncbi:hypothetical protein ACO1PK_13065 [Alishewanella sp. d11]|uniref:hypothetical protein n=1 Tax=Alishewanella sp. d11 TaxID=3414030 RepID=UPI003BF79A46
MKKLAIATLALAMSFSVSAQTEESASSGTSVTTIGGMTIATATTLGISAAVLAAIISNAQESGVLPEGPITPPTTSTVTSTTPNLTLVCNEGDGQPVDGVCTNNSTTVTVTGTGTATSTITVPVTRTYPAILTRI